VDEIRKECDRAYDDEDPDLNKRGRAEDREAQQDSANARARAHDRAIDEAVRMAVTIVVRVAISLVNVGVLVRVISHPGGAVYGAANSCHARDGARRSPVTSAPRPALGSGASGQVLLRVLACGVCRTDLHIVDGELTKPKLPLVPGHQIVGEIRGGGSRYEPGSRVGVPWLGWTCGACRYCLAGDENLCDRARFTGYDVDGGYADLAVADERYCFPIPKGYADEQAAPLLCAGLIGYRALRLAGDGQRIGLYGFGAAAHIVCQVAVAEGRHVYAGTRAGDEEAQSFAKSLGAEWAGDALAGPPDELDSVIVFAPVGELVPAALRHIRRGGSVVCAGIHMSDIPSFLHDLLWGERARSVANLTGRR
jgi:propanol-preferring alcohol dehydrogenase